MKIYIIGVGMGNFDTMTIKAKKIIDSVNIVIGSIRITQIFDKNKIVFNSYKADEILSFLKDKNSDVAILLSGDVGFYSGAKKLLEVLKNYDVVLFPGISSVVYFCSKLKTTWEDIKLLSIHGKKQNVIGYINRYNKVFLLLSGNNDIKQLCEKLCYYNMGNVILHIGQRLSYFDEKIITVKAKDIKNFDFDNLIVVIAENPQANNNSFYSIDDNEFIRGNIPMTKSEIRSLSISKLCLSPNSILYDVGAGTGSVSVEAANKIIDGTVYSIEKNQDALSLIEKNKIKFFADNINIIKGEAPEAFYSLPAPTHIFIGGSSGNMAEIINKGFEKNPNVIIVINIISLNTLSEIFDTIKKKNLLYDISCINISKNKSIGKYEIMTSLNPIYIIKLCQSENL